MPSPFYPASVVAWRNLNGGSLHTINYGASKDLILEHTVQLKPMIKAHFPGRKVSSGIIDVVITSIHPEKTRLKKLMKMIMIMIVIIIIMRKKRWFLAVTRNCLPP